LTRATSRRFKAALEKRIRPHRANPECGEAARLMDEIKVLGEQGMEKPNITDLREHESTRYYITGFRSLLDFHISLRPGLNCLIGPNGSGKSNFIELLDFIYSLTSDSASMAVSEAGGVARVFSQENMKKKSVPLNISIQGISILNKEKDISQQELFFRYHYNIELRFNKHESYLFIKDESLKLGPLTETPELAFSSQWLGHIQVKRKVYKRDPGADIHVSRRLRADSIRNPLAYDYNGRHRSRYADKGGSKRQKYRIGDEINLAGDFLFGPPDRSFFEIAPSFRYPVFRAVVNSMTRGRSFHIDPAAARGPDDLSRPPYIARNGEGLAATLFAIQQMTRGVPVSNYYYSPRLTANTFNELIELSKIVLPSIKGIDVYPDMHTGKYVASIVLFNGLKIPFNAVSDGTVKWLAMLVAIMTNATSYALEEPENFLHPKMQGLLVAFLRDHVDEENFEYSVISSHSETLINNCRPSEIIIFSYDSGKTRARVIENADSLVSEINRTGFGLGYYYASNAIP
jgi:predicted ATPase